MIFDVSKLILICPNALQMLLFSKTNIHRWIRLEGPKSNRTKVALIAELGVSFKVMSVYDHILHCCSNKCMINYTFGCESHSFVHVSRLHLLSLFKLWVEVRSRLVLLSQHPTVFQNNVVRI